MIYRLNRLNCPFGEGPNEPRIYYAHWRDLANTMDRSEHIRSYFLFFSVLHFELSVPCVD